MRRWPVIGLLAVMILGTGCVVLRTCWVRMSPSAIPAIGGKELQIRLSDNGKTFLQKDKRWADDQLGTSNCTLGSHGCLVCSVPMACTNLGVNLTPNDLNERLKENDGFLPQGWVVWNAISRVTDQKLSADYHVRPKHAQMDEALEAGAYPVVKYFLVGGIQHWCVVVGKEGLDYLARDPLRNDAKPVKLSELTEKIHALRTIRRVP
ncbi:MAG: hypothetical protein ACO1TE_20285 [Prosthecobacter sp.]